MPSVAYLNALCPTSCIVQLQVRQDYIDWCFHIANGYIVYSRGATTKLYEHKKPIIWDF